MHFYANILHEWWGDNRATRKEKNPLVYLVFADHYHIVGKWYLTFVAVCWGFLLTSSRFHINDFSSNASKVTGRNMESLQIIIISKMVVWDFTLNVGDMKMKLVHIKPRESCGLCSRLHSELRCGVDVPFNTCSSLFLGLLWRQAEMKMS